MSRTESELRDRIQDAYECRDDEALATLTPQLDALTTATTDAVAGLVVHVAQAAPVPADQLLAQFKRELSRFVKVPTMQFCFKDATAELRGETFSITIQHPQARAFLANEIGMTVERVARDVLGEQARVEFRVREVV